MKKILTVLLILVMVFTFAACGNGGDQGDGGNAEVSFDDISDNYESEDGTYQIAMVTDVGQLKDGSFNQFTWNGVKKYAYDNNKSYKYYQPANDANATDEDRIKAMTDACDAGAEVLVTPGYLQETALKAVAPKYPDVQFVFIDGWDMGMPNLVGVSYQEEQAGYFAGYATVMEGYTKLGFSGGGGGNNPACIRYGYGFAQGANDAAAAKGETVEMRYSWEHGSSFSASPDLQAMLSGWYNAGTEVIFMCGGTMFSSGVAAAEAAEKKIVGVDVDQSGESDAVVTSAMKGLSDAVQWAVAKVYDSTFTEIGGTATSLGVKDNAVELPTAAESWRFETFTVEEYEALYQQMLDGTLVVDNDFSKLESTEWSNVNLNVI